MMPHWVGRADSALGWQEDIPLASNWLVSQKEARWDNPSANHCAHSLEDYLVRALGPRSSSPKTLKPKIPKPRMGSGLPSSLSQEAPDGSWRFLGFVVVGIIEDGISRVDGLGKGELAQLREGKVA